MDYEHTQARARYLSGKHNRTAEENQVKLRLARPKTQAEILGWHVTAYAEYILKKRKLWE